MTHGGVKFANDNRRPEAHHLVVIQYRVYNDVGGGYLLAGLLFT